MDNEISRCQTTKIAAAVFWKFEKLQYLRNETMDFYGIWYNDAYGLSEHRQQIKFSEFDNSRWRQPPSWKIEKS